MNKQQSNQQITIDNYTNVIMVFSSTDRQDPVDQKKMPLYEELPEKKIWSNILEGFWDQTRALPAFLKLFQNGQNYVLSHGVLFQGIEKNNWKSFFFVEISHFENGGGLDWAGSNIAMVHLRSLAPIFKVRYLSEEKRFSIIFFDPLKENSITYYVVLTVLENL